MAEVNEEIARVYFEELGYTVRTNLYYKKKSGLGTGPADIDLLILKPQGKGKYGKKAIVSVKGWHSFTFSLRLMKKSGRLFEMFVPQSIRRAEDFLGKGFKRILIVAKTPKDKKEKVLIKKWLAKRMKIDFLLEFSEILSELIKRTDNKRNYPNSEVQQTIRLLKNYKFLTKKKLI